MTKQDILDRLESILSIGIMTDEAKDGIESLRADILDPKAAEDQRVARMRKNGCQTEIDLSPGFQTFLIAYHIDTLCKLRISDEARHILDALREEIRFSPGYPVEIYPDYRKERDANARLIAAAPALLAASKRIHELFKGEDDPEQADLDEALLDLAAAITKAEGGANP